MQPLTETQRETVSAYYDYAMRVAGHLGKRHVSPSDEVLGAAHFALIEAVTKYDPVKCSSLRSYIACTVRQRSKDVHRATLRRESRYADFDTRKIVDYRSVESDAEFLDWFRWITSRLDRSATDLIRAVIFNGETVSSYARKEGKSGPHQYATFYTTIEHMRNKYADFEAATRAVDRRDPRQVRRGLADSRGTNQPHARR